MKRICEHFKSFTSRLDSHLNDKLVDLTGGDGSGNSDDDMMQDDAVQSVDASQT